MFVYYFYISGCGIVFLLCVLCVLCVLCSVSALRVSPDLCFFGVGWGRFRKVGIARKGTGRVEIN